VDLKKLAAKMALPKVRADLAEVQLQDPVRMMSTLLLDEAALAEYTKNAQINTDDLPYIEFDTDITTPIGLRNMGEMLQRRSKPWEDVVNSTVDQRAALDRCWQAFPKVAEGWGRTFIPGDYARATKAYDAAIAIEPADPRPRYLRAMAVGRAYLAQPEQFATSEQRRLAIAAIEAGLRPGEMPAERFAARARAALGLLYVQEGDLAQARRQASLMHRITPQPEEQRMLLEALGELGQQ
jgi:tetratricopeptide (TPR) repeat protein